MYMLYTCHMKVGSEMGSLNDILYPTVETVDFFLQIKVYALRGNLHFEFF